MNAEVSKIFRSVQVHFPFLQDYRFTVQRNLRSFLNKTHELDFEVLSHLPRTANNLFLDIGSNRGDAVQSILMRRPDAAIMAFEPNVYLNEKVRRIYKGDERVTINDFGLGSATGAFTLYIPFYNNYMFDGLASFKEANARNWLKSRLYGYQESRLKIVKTTCQVKKLDDLNLQPYFMKIDVQGFEHDVLLGGANTIATHRPILLIETPGTKELEFLRSYGYKSYVYRNSKLVEGAEGLNVFFIPPTLQNQIK